MSALPASPRIAARGKIVHIPEDVYKVHADAGKVTFIDYVRS